MSGSPNILCMHNRVQCRRHCCKVRPTWGAQRSNTWGNISHLPCSLLNRRDRTCYKSILSRFWITQKTCDYVTESSKGSDYVSNERNVLCKLLSPDYWFQKMNGKRLKFTAFGNLFASAVIKIGSCDEPTRSGYNLFELIVKTQHFLLPPDPMWRTSVIKHPHSGWLI